MATLAQLWVEFRASTEKFADDMSAVNKHVRDLDKEVKPITDRLKDMGTVATQMGTALTVAVTAPIAAIAGLGISFNAMQEQATIAFTKFLGTGERAKVFIGELKDFAAKTPFEFPDLVTGSQRLLNVGFAARDIIPMMTAIGDAAAFSGKGAVAIDRITNAIVQMKQKHAVSAEEMTQQLGELIPAWEFVAKKIGVDVPTAMKMAQKGAIDVDVAIQGLLEGMTERFGGGMAQMATTWTGLISTIKDGSRFLAGELTEGLFNALKGPLNSLANGLLGLAKEMDSWSDSTKAVIAVVAGLAAAAGPVLFIFGQFLISLSSIISVGARVILLFGEMVFGVTTIGATFSALGAAIAGTAAVIAGPLAIAIAAVALGAFVIDAFNLGDEIKALISNTWELVKALGALGIEVASQTWAALKYDVGLVKDTLVDFANWVKSSWIGEQLGFMIGNQLKGAAEMAKQAADYVRSFMPEDWQGSAGHTERKPEDLYGPSPELIAKLLKKGTPDKEYTTQVEALEKALRKTTVEQNALSQAITYAESRHISWGVILDAFGPKLKEISRDHQEYGTAIKESLVPAIRMQENHESMMRVMKMMDEEINKEVESIDKINAAWLDAEAATMRYNAAMAMLPLGTAAAARQFETLLDLIDRTNASLSANPVPWRNIPLSPATANLPINFGPIPTAQGQRLPDPDPEIWRKWRQAGQQVIDHWVNDMSRMFTESVIHGKSFWEAFKSMGDNAITSLADTVLTKFFHRLLDPLNQAIGKMMDNIVDQMMKGFGNILSTFLGGFGSKLAGILGMGNPGVIMNAAGGAASAGGEAAGGIGGAAGAASGWMSLAGGVAGGVISGLMGMRQEGTLNAIEYNTRVGMIALQYWTDNFMLPVKFATEKLYDCAYFLQYIAERTAPAMGSPATSIGPSLGGVVLDKPTFAVNMYFTDKITRQSVKEDIMPEALDFLADNVNSYLERLIQIIQSSEGGVMTSRATAG